MVWQWRKRCPGSQWFAIHQGWTSEGIGDNILSQTQRTVHGESYWVRSTTSYNPNPPHRWSWKCRFVGCVCLLSFYLSYSIHASNLQYFVRMNKILWCCALHHPRCDGGCDANPWGYVGGVDGSQGVRRASAYMIRGYWKRCIVYVASKAAYWIQLGEQWLIRCASSKEVYQIRIHW